MRSPSCTTRLARGSFLSVSGLGICSTSFCVSTASKFLFFISEDPDMAIGALDGTTTTERCVTDHRTKLEMPAYSITYSWKESTPARPLPQRISSVQLMDKCRIPFRASRGSWKIETHSPCKLYAAFESGGMPSGSHIIGGRLLILVRR